MRGCAVVTRLDEARLAHLAAACAAAEVVARWRAKIVTVEGSDCQWWTGAVSGAVIASILAGAHQNRARAPVRVRAGARGRGGGVGPGAGAPL